MPSTRMLLRSKSRDTCGNDLVRVRDAWADIATTNDMRIVDPGRFDARGLVPCQINTQYTNAPPPGNQGETRNQRLAQYRALHLAVSVLA